MPDDARTSIMGHTSLDMTAHYTHWQPRALADMIVFCQVEVVRLSVLFWSK